MNIKEDQERLAANDRVTVISLTRFFDIHGNNLLLRLNQLAENSDNLYFLSHHDSSLCVFLRLPPFFFFLLRSIVRFVRSSVDVQHKGRNRARLMQTLVLFNKQVKNSGIAKKRKRGKKGI